jgi:16S rRNA C967 or C1407 C5-methylase (RsmB/RsmF family)
VAEKERTMSANKLINAVIALVEDRPEVAKEMLRSPEMRLSSTEVQGRLARALEEREAKAIVAAMKSVLRLSLRADPAVAAEEEGIEWTAPQEEDSERKIHDEAFYQGVAFVERLLEEYIEGFTA